MKKKKIDFQELVRSSFVKMGFMNPDKIDMHVALWMEGLDKYDVLDLYHNIEKACPLKISAEMEEELLKKITTNSSLASIAKVLQEALEPVEEMKKQLALFKKRNKKVVEDAKTTIVR